MRINVNCDIISFVLFIYFLICFAKKKFSIPYTQFYNLVNEIRRDKWFPSRMVLEARRSHVLANQDVILVFLF